MAVTYGFFNSVNGDRKYNAEQMSEYFRGIINEGVYQHLDGGLAVTAGTGLAVSVASGRAIIQNRWVQNSAALSLTIAAASETYARKDAVVIRLNWSSRSISIAVKTGTPAASPVAPSMTRNSTTYEMALAYVNVAANVTSVTVTDKRSDSTVCGWVTVAQSTSGEVDAQLNALKTGFDGVEYPSPAAMVQGEDEKINSDLVSESLLRNATQEFDDYILTASGLATATGFAVTSKFDVSGKNNLMIVLPNCSASVAGIGFFNSSDQMFSFVPYSKQEYIRMTLPVGAVKARMTLKKDENWDLRSVNTEYQYSISKYELYNIDLKMGTGVLQSNNTINAASVSVVYTVDYISLREAKRIVLTMSASGSSPAICFYDKDYNFISGVSYLNKTTVDLVVPDNAKYCRFSVVKTSLASFSAKIETKNEDIIQDIIKAEEQNNENIFAGKNVAILCDSIGTHGNEGTWPNVPEITITADDVGKELKAYLTYYDLYTDYGQSGSSSSVYTGMSLGGNALSVDQIGTEITFTPIEEDIGKSVGKVHDWNGNSLDVWWVLLAQKFKFNPIPVCWASSSYSSHEESRGQAEQPIDMRLDTAYAWHPAQIRKSGIRTPGTMTRVAPDYVILSRGCNDMTHVPYDKVTEETFASGTWDYPENDAVTGGYGIKEALCLTIKNLREAYPNAQIILTTIPYVKRVNFSHFPSNNGETTYPQWNESIKEVAEYFGCKVIDFAKDGVTHNNLSSYSGDNTHPNAKGHAMMAEEAIRAFNSMLL